MVSITDDPETKQVLGAMAMMNMEGEGISDVRAYFRDKLIKMGVVKPTDDEAAELKKELEGQKPSAQDQYLEAAAQRERTEAIKNQVEIISEQAKADKIKAETVEIISGLDRSDADLALRTIEKLGPSVTPPSLPGSPIVP